MHLAVPERPAGLQEVDPPYIVETGDPEEFEAGPVDVEQHPPGIADRDPGGGILKYPPEPFRMTENRVSRGASKPPA